MGFPPPAGEAEIDCHIRGQVVTTGAAVLPKVVQGIDHAPILGCRTDIEEIQDAVKHRAMRAMNRPQQR